jgi:hypothetical protein
MRKACAKKTAMPRRLARRAHTRQKKTPNQTFNRLFGFLMRLRI